MPSRSGRSAGRRAASRGPAWRARPGPAPRTGWSLCRALALLGDDLLHGTVEPRAQRPSDVVGQEERDLPQLLLVELPCGQCRADLDLDDLGQPLGRDRAEYQQAAVT